VIGDALGSVGAIVAGILMLTKGWYVADPLISFVVGLLILYNSWRLVKDSVDILLEGTPAHIDLETVRSALNSVEGVASIHDLHIWTLTSGIHAMSCHALFAATMTVIRFWNNSATSCAAVLRLTTQRFNWRRSVSVIRRIIPAMNVRLLEGHLDETFLHAGHHRSDRTTGFCGRLLSQVLHGKALTLRLMLVCVAMVFVKMMEIRDRLF
jgi:hypothetical protein